MKDFRNGPIFWPLRNISVVPCLNRKELNKERQKVTYEARQKGIFCDNFIGPRTVNEGVSTID